MKRNSEDPGKGQDHNQGCKATAQCGFLTLCSERKREGEGGGEEDRKSELHGLMTWLLQAVKSGYLE